MRESDARSFLQFWTTEQRGVAVERLLFQNKKRKVTSGTPLGAREGDTGCRALDGARA